MFEFSTVSIYVIKGAFGGKEVQQCISYTYFDPFGKRNIIRLHCFECSALQFEHDTAFEVQ
jgi:hypothetical protein